MSKSKGGRLEFRREAGGIRHYLAGEPVHAGELLELERADGSWVLGRYEGCVAKIPIPDRLGKKAK